MAEVGDLYPGTQEKIVGVVYNQNGPGRWLQGEFGGVFAEGGAPYLGSYMGLDAAARNDPNRRFTGIEAFNGGYRSLTSTPGEAGYGFGAPPPAAPPPAPAPTPQQQRAGAPGASSAKGELASTLAQYGLPASLADQLWDDEYINKGTPIQTIVNLVLPNTQQYKDRFPGLTQLQARRNGGEPGVTIPSVAEYLQLETGIAGVLQDAGLPPDFYDKPDDFAKWIGGSTSPKEVEDRIGFARNVAFSMPVETREELSRVYDLDQGELLAYVLDPSRGLEAIQKRVQGAAIGGASKRTGFGLLTQQEMEQLAGSGITEDAAGRAFGELVPQEGLFAETAGESMTGDELGRSEQIGYAAGSATAAAAMDTRRKRRAGQFQGGGGAASGGEGKTGLG